MQCNKKKLTGRVAEMRTMLKPLLKVGSTRALEFPAYETQDEWHQSEEESDSDSDSSHRVSVSLSFDELRVGECVQVYWKGENQWFEGEVTDLDEKDRTFEVYYPSDGKKLWHDEDNYPIQLSCYFFFFTKKEFGLGLYNLINLYI